jgi:hypothetical protein
MSDDTQAAPQAPQQPPQIDPAFFTCINELLELANTQANRYGLGRISLVSVHATARFNAHAYLEDASGDLAAQRTGFLDYMTRLYRRLLNDHLDTLGAARGVDVGESELAEEYKANGYVPGKGFVDNGPA